MQAASGLRGGAARENRGRFPLRNGARDFSMSTAPTPSSLRAFLQSRGGAVPWRHWMEAALYDPERGYYAAQIRTVGRRGDFSTSATLSSSLGKAVARWIVQQWNAAGRKLPLIEIGPGDGSLHRSVLACLGFCGRRGLRSHLVERSPVLRAVQQERLRRWRSRITWHDTVETALEAADGAALLFSNELADAFPATLLQWQGGRWHEVWLRIAYDGGIVEELRDCPPGLTSSACGIPWDDGQRIEVLQSWREWLTAWRSQWKAGAMLTIDYGGRPAEIYYRRPGGTVRGFLHHQRLDGAALYTHMGRCDVTVDVNFTDLRQWGEALALETVECVTQREFAGRYLDIEGDPLYDVGGPAEAFRCLVQRPAVR